MRQLKFKVSGQEIKKDTTCNFKRIIAGTENYLEACFTFASDWSGMKKIAIFKRLDSEYPAKIIDGKCTIPSEALTWRNFSVSVIGRKDDMTVKTNNITIEQEVN